MEITFDLLQTMGVAALVFYLGNYVKSKITVLQTYFIPAPVVGGVLCSLLLFGAEHAGITVKFDMNLLDFFMNIFFAATGFICSFALIKKSGKQGAILAVGSVAFLFVQNFVGIGAAELLGMHPLMGVAIGSTSMSGGIGSAAAFGPIMEAHGAVGATTIGVAAATFGLLLGSLTGGPVAYRLIIKYKLKSTALEDDVGKNKNIHELNEKKLFRSLLVIFLACMIGVYIRDLFLMVGFHFPYFLGCMIGGMIFRNVADAGIGKLDQKEIDIIGNISLNMFITLALMSLNINKLVNLALPMLVILLVQVVVMVIWAYFITFRTMYKDYDAAVMAAGHCGIGLGQTPNALANMKAVEEKNGPAPKAWLILPVITVTFVALCNPIVITLFIDWFR